MQKDYYKEYFDLERRHWWFVAREKIIIDHITSLINGGLLNNSPLKILNVGCGPGRSSQYLSEFGPVSSIEYDKDCCEFAAERTGLNILHGSITELPFEGGIFDLVCAFDVIEHVEDDQLAVAEMKRVAKEGGVILITVPAFMSLWSHHDVINHHHRRYKRLPLKKLFAKEGGGREVFSSYFNSFLFPPIFIVRRLSGLLSPPSSRKGSGSDFEAFKPGVFNTFLRRLMSSESWFLRNRFKFPAGVSIIYSWKKL